ncbi:MAG TPA: hypothetical protein VKQ32_13440, partial [Polyangia bacterium]|nr:hypothetical protein [Polyangia bacterium]
SGQMPAWLSLASCCSGAPDVSGVFTPAILAPPIRSIVREFGTPPFGGTIVRRFRTGSCAPFRLWRAGRA